MKKQYKVFSSKDSYEYDISVMKTEEDTSYFLFYSFNELWTHPGDLILSIVDDGNNLKISKKIGNILEYDELVELHILLSLIKKLDCDQGSTEKYTIIEVKDTIEV